MFEFGLKAFDARKAEESIRSAFYEVKDLLDVTEQEINFFVNEDLIREFQERRVSKFTELKELKADLQLRFRDYRIEGRIKSLTSLLGKHMKSRKLLDTFGLKIIVGSIYECYAMKDWILRRYNLFEMKDRIEEPCPNGYRDIKLTVEYENTYLEFIIQTPQMYVDSHTLQPHNAKYPWKYHPAILGLPGEYGPIYF